MLKFIEKTKIWFGISSIIILIGIFTMAFKGLEYGIDFAGGSVTDVKVPSNFTDKAGADKIILQYIPDATTSITENNTDPNNVVKAIEIKSKGKAQAVGGKTTTMVTDLQKKYGNDVSLYSQDDIGSAVGKETRNKAILAIIISISAMLIYIGIRFEFKFGTAAVIALVHDILITLTFYAVFRKPIDSGFVAAMLTVTGYSMCDTIVVFDRIRENQRYMGKASINELVDWSLTQTLARSIITVLTVVITLISVYIFVPSIRNFSEPLLVGIISGCYSSIFIASPFWVIFKKRSKKKPAVAKK